jgi:hypothetical protein
MSIKNKITLVTGIWDLKRESAKEGWARSFDHYINNFIKLLTELKDYNLIIFIDKDHEDIVWKYRNKANTRVYHHSKNDFSGNFFPFFDSVQTIRNNPDWYNQVGWLKDSTQGSLEYYNPMVMSKMFLLHNAKAYDPFGSEYFFWIDGGITNTLSLGYFNKQHVIENLLKSSKKMLFICFPYETTSEIHGFSIEGMKKYSRSKTVNRVARGGFFGGHKDYISDANGLYYDLLSNSLNEGYMGTEESIFTIMTYLDPSKYHFEMINGDGLIYTFFEKLQETKYKPSNSKDVITYINTFNSAKQLQMLMDSFEKYEPKILSDTKIVLINNTVPTEDNHAIFEEYNSIITKYNMTEIKNGNMGICGARQWCAEHFDASSSDYMLFFEDDMLLNLNGYCKFGFKRQINNFLETIIEIISKENYDFLKVSFSEFYGNNSDQWSWHNLPKNLKEEYFGNISDKPKTQFSIIKSINGTPYAEGEIYYSNWPHIIGKEGNKKMFLDTKWAHPYEQTWMSHFYTLTKQNKLKPSILLASPILHNRKYHYNGSERKEN